jgi:hypothetical protein
MCHDLNVNIKIFNRKVILHIFDVEEIFEIRFLNLLWQRIFNAKKRPLPTQIRVKSSIREFCSPTCKPSCVHLLEPLCLVWLWIIIIPVWLVWQNIAYLFVWISLCIKTAKSPSFNPKFFMIIVNLIKFELSLLYISVVEGWFPRQ